METIRYGGQTFTIIFPDLIRPLNPTELAALRESIQAHGIKVPVIVDGAMGVIDGAHRLREGVQQGITVPWVVQAGYSDEEKKALAIALNRDRRQLTLEEQAELRGQRVERVVKARKSGKSTRQIAEKEGVSHTQVLRDLGDGTGTPVPVETESGKVVGLDGKERSATRKRTIAEHFRTSKPAENEGSEAKKPTPEKEPETKEEEIKRINGEIESYCRKLMALGDEMPKDAWLADMNRREGAMRKIKDACSTLRSCKCHAPCPLCKNGCQKCHKTGRVPKLNYDQMV